jgi:hypothetical protein
VVDFYPSKGFLVLLPTLTICDRALSANSGLTVGHAKLQLLPWTRMAGAEVLKLPFRVHLWIEGVPHHVCQPSTIRQLLPQGTQLEGIDRDRRNDNEAQCCCIMVWSRNRGGPNL